MVVCNKKRKKKRKDFIWSACFQLRSEYGNIWYLLVRIRVQYINDKKNDQIKFLLSGLFNVFWVVSQASLPWLQMIIKLAAVAEWLIQISCTEELWKHSKVFTYVNRHSLCLTFIMRIIWAFLKLQAVGEFPFIEKFSSCW